MVSKYGQYVLWFRPKARVCQTDQRMNGQNYGPQDRASVAASRGKNVSTSENRFEHKFQITTTVEYETHTYTRSFLFCAKGDVYRYVKRGAFSLPAWAPSLELYWGSYLPGALSPQIGRIPPLFPVELRPSESS